MAEEPGFAADVAIIGGGTAGCFAAMAAAQEGAQVVLLEKDEAVGGVGMRAGINAYHFGSRGGLQNDVDRQTLERQRTLGGYSAPYHPEAKGSVISERLRRLGVRVLLNTVVYEALTEGRRVVGVKYVSDRGLGEVRAKVVIDCTADGDIAALAGASFTVGRAFDGVSHLYSLAPRVLKPDGKSGGRQLGVMNFDAGWVDPLDVDDVSLAYMEGRGHLLRMYEEAAESGSSGYELLAAAPQLGIREGRHIVGDYVLQLEDYLYDRHFADVVIRSYSHYDTHARDLGNESDFSQIWLVVMDRFVKDGLWCDVPYRCLLPRGLDGMLVASRALSLDREVSMGVRMQRDMHKLGEAAGVAGAMAALSGRNPRDLEADSLQRRLTERGVLQPEDLNRSASNNLRFRSGPLASRPLDRSRLARLDSVESAELAGSLIGYLGTEEEGLALWWMREWGAPCVQPLLRRLNADEEPAARTAAAFGLALLGRQEAVPLLLELLVRREDGRRDRLDIYHKAYPKWLSAIVLLRLLDSPAAYREAVKALQEGHSASINTFLLQYLYQIADRAEPEEREQLARLLPGWLGELGPGADYVAQGERVTVSLRWNLTHWAALLLSRLGKPEGGELCRPYLKDPRKFVRTAARLALERAAARKKE
ncbi:FAD-dependent oxidoreductase [Paenibacillaceae bacterium WGS1546]|uniref:FAD-dependent oxidoreductase n=1 Tax=Cohnella sp. WGS1546 TaxID=3366810 RepID=UPI00372D3D3F